MELIYNKIFLEHHTGDHPESARRLLPFAGLPDAPLVNGEELLGLVHRSDYIEKVRDACREEMPFDADTVVSLRSFDVACHGVGAAVKASETNGFAIIRPPGHHAFPARASGFCLFNNIAVAVQNLVEQGNRVAIIDFDGHLGDGTSYIFYPTNQVLFMSLHQFPAFPGNGFVDEIGEGRGKGFTINVPLPPMSGDDIFMDAFNSFLPAVEQFSPDVVAVSAGFDAHQFDPLLELQLSTQVFHTIGRILGERFPRLFAVLEGGYNTEEMPRCLHNFVAGINGQAPEFPTSSTISGRRVWETYEIYMNAVMGHLKPYWKF